MDTCDTVRDIHISSWHIFHMPLPHLTAAMNIDLATGLVSEEWQNGCSDSSDKHAKAMNNRNTDT